MAVQTAVDWGNAQLINYLLCKQEGLRLKPTALVKQPSVVTYACNPSAGQAVTLISLGLTGVGETVSKRQGGQCQRMDT